jgi:hypothetical protein
LAVATSSGSMSFKRKRSRHEKLGWEMIQRWSRANQLLTNFCLVPRVSLILPPSKEKSLLYEDVINKGEGALAARRRWPWFLMTW